MCFISRLNKIALNFTRNLEVEAWLHSTLFLATCTKFIVGRCVPNVWNVKFAIFQSLAFRNLMLNWVSGACWFHVFCTVLELFVIFKFPDSTVLAVSLFTERCAQNTEFSFISWQNSIVTFNTKVAVRNEMLGALNSGTSHVSERELVEHVSWFLC